RKDVVGTNNADYFEETIANMMRRHDEDTLTRRKPTMYEEWLTDADGSAVLMECRREPIFDDNGVCTGLLLVARDITESKEQQKDLEYLARHDSLTGLGNRHLLNQQLSFALQMNRRNEEALAVIFIDLDRFKDINDTLGHHIGDLLLRDVAHRLRSNVRDSDICARLGGDEFVVVLSQIEMEHISEKCDHLLASIAKPYQLQGHLLSIYASAGIAIAPDHGDNASVLIINADAALQQAKLLGRNRSCLYTEAMTVRQDNKLTLEQDLNTAIKEQKLSLVYQAQFCPDDDKPRRVEALLRWKHPVRGFISPHEFIPLAETSGLIMELGIWVLRHACIQFLQWRENGLRLEKIAVNVSAMQLNANFAETVRDMLIELKFDPHWLELEVTESLMMSGMTEVSVQIHELRKLGVEFSIDDFGTGYSSLSKLKSMPVSVLKIDQSFVRNIHKQSNDFEIARAIVAMARSLNLIVVAEGIENQEQETTLKKLGCDWLQGFLYGNPMSGEEFLRQYGA
ncbi:MAG: EAL domain-containing protein, partial [Oleibacter sp.]|nr:EAL domain-containing protein [Thalassolituus sp.]